MIINKKIEKFALIIYLSKLYSMYKIEQTRYYVSILFEYFILDFRHNLYILIILRRDFMSRD